MEWKEKKYEWEKIETGKKYVYYNSDYKQYHSLSSTSAVRKEADMGL